MRRSTSMPCNDYCWVYITRDSDSSRRYHIGFALDLPQLLNDNLQCDILYYRQFNNTMDGLAHKLFLTNVNNETLLLVIRGMNPEMRDLRRDFQ